jgi:transposase-like protein
MLTDYSTPAPGERKAQAGPPFRDTGIPNEQVMNGVEDSVSRQSSRGQPEVLFEADHAPLHKHYLIKNTHLNCHSLAPLCYDRIGDRSAARPSRPVALFSFMDNTILQNSTLSPVQAQVITALAAGASISAAAKAAGVHRSTVHNWLNEPNFATLFDTSRQDYVESLRDQLRDLSVLALDTIRQLLENPDTPASVRLRAAQLVLNRPHFPKQEWALPEPISSPQQQLHNAEMAALEADYNHLCLREEIEKSEVRAGATPIEAIARNARCPCGSGLKYKRCCGASAPPLLSGKYQSSGLTATR